MLQGKSLWFDSNSHGKHTTHFSPNSILFRMLRAPHYWRSQFCELFRWIYICWPWTELFSREKSVSGAVLCVCCICLQSQNRILLIFLAKIWYIQERAMGVCWCWRRLYRVVLLLSSIGRALLSATWWLIASLESVSGTAFCQVKAKLFLENETHNMVNNYNTGGWWVQADVFKLNYQ